MKSLRRRLSFGRRSPRRRSPIRRSPSPLPKTPSSGSSLNVSLSPESLQSPSSSSSHSLSLWIPLRKSMKGLMVATPSPSGSREVSSGRKHSTRSPSSRKLSPLVQHPHTGQALDDFRRKGMLDVCSGTMHMLTLKEFHALLYLLEHHRISHSFDKRSRILRFSSAEDLQRFLCLSRRYH